MFCLRPVYAPASNVRRSAKSSPPGTKRYKCAAPIWADFNLERTIIPVATIGLVNLPRKSISCAIVSSPVTPPAIRDSNQIERSDTAERSYRGARCRRFRPASLGARKGGDNVYSD